MTLVFFFAIHVATLLPLVKTFENLVERKNLWFHLIIRSLKSKYLYIINKASKCNHANKF